MKKITLLLCLSFFSMQSSYASADSESCCRKTGMSLLVVAIAASIGIVDYSVQIKQSQTAHTAGYQQGFELCVPYVRSDLYEYNPYWECNDLGLKTFKNGLHLGKKECEALIRMNLEEQKRKNKRKCKKVVFNFHTQCADKSQ